MNEYIFNWTPVGDRIPSNANENYEGQPCTPFVSCIVFACYPGKPQGGVIETCQWDRDKGTWEVNSIRSKWVLQPPYIITHFCDKLPKP